MSEPCPVLKWTAEGARKTAFAASIPRRARALIAGVCQYPQRARIFRELRWYRGDLFTVLMKQLCCFMGAVFVFSAIIAEYRISGLVNSKTG